MTLAEMKQDIAIRQKKGVHFILASLFIWAAILLVQLSSLPILTKNLLTFVFSTPLLPIAFLISRVINIDFSSQDNPLSKLGLLFSLNQVLYILIAIWVYPTVPNKLVMILAMIYGAHLLPYSWLYESKSYLIMSVFITPAILIIGLIYNPVIIAITMLSFQIIFSILLFKEISTIENLETISQPNI